MGAQRPYSFFPQDFFSQRLSSISLATTVSSIVLLTLTLILTLFFIRLAEDRSVLVTWIVLYCTRTVLDCISKRIFGERRKRTDHQARLGVQIRFAAGSLQSTIIHHSSCATYHTTTTPSRTITTPDETRRYILYETKRNQTKRNE